ncbi:glycosyltransferase family 4 protein [Mesorhizobium sp.]|uniref:glycosyltransferase family 4 protein n=1 Tax=Mesorhizobium sp. TaxID=1871066 RepID=UPI00120A6765|nr:glycosyltransferase family 4 protein [Mesorhizobium sp.]TIN26416.1 MAG: glycosyltransferase family 4 protein [Mesorhizobium sp.]
MAVVFDNFGPYHMARLAGAAKSMDVLGVEVAGKSAEYDWDAPNAPEDLQRVRLLEDGSGRSDWSLLSAAYDDRVGRWRPDAIALPGWSSPAALAGAHWAARCRIPAIVMSESNANDFSRHPALEFVKRRLVTQFQAGLCGGTEARSYLAKLGMLQERISIGYDVIDNDYFANGALVVRASGGAPGCVNSSWRGRFFLASARFIEKKNLPRLVEAFARYRSAVGPGAWPLVLLGDGQMRAELERLRAQLGLGTSLLMPGFIQYGDLPLYYGSAGAFIHASTTEQWGLVVNEAMASGLPVIVSERCGCAADLVEDGCNGHTFDPRDTYALTRLMLQIASDSCDREAMGRASQDVISRWSPQTFADGLRQAAQVAIDAPLPRRRLLEKTLLWAMSHR